ncbi:phosphatase PAP2 family protein [Sphingobium lactosutens]|uniref:phosphatase PAP2 family protein n=1 Tax=Sphingobium lactosutens TaxID=522773 RepID=UPI0021189B16|nr:phosphatase PAP2 family protein [Sphingobium lactosutens]
MLGALMYSAGLHFDPSRPSNIPYIAGGLVAVVLRFALPRTAWRHAGVVAHFSEYAALFTIISLMGASASYPIAALTQGYADATLHHIDLYMGFDWLALYRLVCNHPWLQMAGTIAYRSIYITPALLLWRCACTGDKERAYRFLASFWLAAFLTLAIFSRMPAIGPLSYLWHGPISYMPESEVWQSGLIPALREHQLQVVDLGQLRGIVSAPSFHTAAAILYMAMAWRLGALRWPVLILNVAMLVSTPVEGTHYLVDMILGGIVAVSALVLIHLYLQLRQKYQDLDPDVQVKVASHVPMLI